MHTGSAALGSHPLTMALDAIMATCTQPRFVTDD